MPRKIHLLRLTIYNKTKRHLVAHRDCFSIARWRKKCRDFLRSIQNCSWYLKISTFIHIQVLSLEPLKMFCRSVIWNQCYNITYSKLHVIWMKVAHYLLSKGFGIGVRHVGSSGSVSDLCSGCSWFESWLRCFMPFLSLFAIATVVVRTMPHAFEFIIHWSCNNSVLYCLTFHWASWLKQVCFWFMLWGCPAQNGTHDINFLDWYVS